MTRSAATLLALAALALGAVPSPAPAGEAAIVDVVARADGPGRFAFGPPIAESTSWESEEDLPFRHSLAVFRIGAGTAATQIVPSEEDLAAVGRLSRRDRADYAPRLAALRRKAGS